MYIIPQGTPTLVFVPGSSSWDDYTTEEEMRFENGDVGKVSVTFRWMGTCLQVRRENITSERDGVPEREQPR